MAKRRIVAPIEEAAPITVVAPPVVVDDGLFPIVLDEATGQTVVRVPYPRRRLQHVAGRTWSHVATDHHGRWIYRPE